MAAFNHILVAVDGSKNAEKAFVEAVSIAKRNEASLYIATIINEDELATSSFAFSKVLSEEKEQAEVNMLKRIQDAEQQGVTSIRAIVETGIPEEFISQTIPQNYPIDLIVVGATGRGILSRGKIGSTTQKIIDQADCSVLVIK